MTEVDKTGVYKDDESDRTFMVFFVTGEQERGFYWMDGYPGGEPSGAVGPFDTAQLAFDDAEAKPGRIKLVSPRPLQAY